MYFVPLTKRQIKARRGLADDVRRLCQRCTPMLNQDLQKLSLMEHFHPQYYQTEFPKVSHDMVILNVFGMPLQSPDEFDWKSLFDHWLELRVVIAKYLGPDDHDFREIDRLCGHLSLRKVPQIIPTFRPSKPLLYAEWETHPNRERCLAFVALLYWGLKDAPSCTFKDVSDESVSESENDNTPRQEVSRGCLDPGPLKCGSSLTISTTPERKAPSLTTVPCRL